MHAGSAAPCWPGSIPLVRMRYIFDIADQFSRGVGAIGRSRSAANLPGLLVAGRRAKFTSAYVSALNYTRAGLALLRSDGRR